MAMAIILELDISTKTRVIISNDYCQLLIGWPLSGLKYLIQEQLPSVKTAG